MAMRQHSLFGLIRESPPAAHRVVDPLRTAGLRAILIHPRAARQGHPHLWAECWTHQVHWSWQQRRRPAWACPDHAWNGKFPTRYPWWSLWVASGGKAWLWCCLGPGYRPTGGTVPT